MITRVFHSAKNTFSLVIRRGMASAKAIEDKIQVDDVKINYVKVGSGERAVLLLPGALGSAKTDFGPQIEKLPDILPNFTLIGWDPPGYGKSIPPRRQFPLDFFYKDARYAHKLMENLSFKKYSILGWSDGGITGMIQAAEFPNAVENLAIWGSNAYIAPKEIEIYESIRDVSKWSERMRKPMEEVYGVEDFPKLWGEWIDALMRIYKEKDGNLCKHLLKSISCPTLILHEQKDPMIVPEHVPYLLDNIKGARLHTFPDGKHNIHLRYAEDFNKEVANFLTQSAKL
ncbi:valacyclovir hydrolase-like [Phlebotomus papatasi]|uniref:valacyclovir hydrolase-like n=1 Tax=Phlebotomus papatasi TaxID=29031 RepID=UPI0024844945|nr:valacyclovir hydrolase-like [Phlebotomus papatasi]